MLKIVPRRWFSSALIVVILPLPFGLGRSAKIDHLQVEAQSRQLSINFRVSGAFTDEVEEIIASGLPVTFHHTVRAYRRRAGWFDQRVAETVVTTSAAFDTLTKQYSVSRTVDGQMVDTLVTDKAEDMRNWMTVIDGILLSCEHDTEPLERYYVKVKSEIQNRFVFFFIPWDFETDWAKSTLIQPHETLEP
ncbi:MAG: DUF4390 domain-containing protein [Acidobacteriota bacterium]